MILPAISPAMSSSAPLHFHFALLLPLDVCLRGLLRFLCATSADPSLPPLLVLSFVFLVLPRRLTCRRHDLVLALEDDVRVTHFGMITVLARWLYPVESVLGRHVSSLQEFKNILSDTDDPVGEMLTSPLQAEMATLELGWFLILPW